MAMAPAPLPSLGLVLQPAYVLAGDVGAFTWTGNAAALTQPGLLGQSENPAPLPSLGSVMTRAPSITLVAEAGAFSVQVAPSESDFDLVGSPGAFTLSGQAAGVVATHLPLVAAAGAYTLTGNPAVLSGANEYRMDGEPGAFTLTGVDAVPVLARILQADVGTLTFDGQAAGGVKGAALVAEAGAFTLSGQAASLNRVSMTSRYGRRRRLVNALISRRRNRLF